MKNSREIKELFDSMALSKQKSKLIIGGGGDTGGGGIIPDPPGTTWCILNNCNQACNTICTNCVTASCLTKSTLWG